MAKYLLLYGGGSMPETDAEMAAVTKAWTDWFTELGPAVVDPGNPFNADSKTISRYASSVRRLGRARYRSSAK